jgi:hypothetical protein
MYAYLRQLITRGTTRLTFAEATEERKVRVLEDQPNERFTLIIALMIVFFVGLVGLEIVNIAILGTWNEATFNGLMLVVGTIVGAVWGRSQ